MSWSAGDNVYPITTTIEEINALEYESHYSNRGHREPIFSKVRELKHDISPDLESAKEYVSEHLSRDGSGCVKFYAPKESSVKKLDELFKRILAEAKKNREWSAKQSVKNQKAKLITCTKCESKVAKDYLRTSETSFTTYHGFLEIWDGTGVNVSSYVEKCPVCGNVMQSKTMQETLKKREEKVVALRDKYLEQLKTLPKEVKWYVYSRMYLG